MAEGFVFCSAVASGTGYYPVCLKLFGTQPK